MNFIRAYGASRNLFVILEEHHVLAICGQIVLLILLVV